MAYNIEMRTITHNWDNPGITAVLWNCYMRYRAAFHEYGSLDWINPKFEFFVDWFITNQQHSLEFFTSDFRLKLAGASKEFKPRITPSGKVYWLQEEPYILFDPTYILCSNFPKGLDLLEKNTKLCYALAKQHDLHYRQGERIIRLPNSRFSLGHQVTNRPPQSILI